LACCWAARPVTSPTGYSGHPGPLRGFVIDWIKLPYFPPTFNLADSAITIGAAVIVLASARGWRLDGDRPRPDPTTQQAAPGTDLPPPLNP
jgi:hypothetical protein